MTRKEQKAQLRQTMRGIAEGLSQGYRQEADQAILGYLLALPEYQESGTVLAYAGTGWEIDTRPLLEDVLRAGKRLCLPLCGPEGRFTLREVKDLGELQDGAYGIPEPPETAAEVDTDAVDFAVLPCLSCNYLGQRLGRGGGYYDRFLAHYRGGTVLLCREKQIREEIPVEPLDMPVPWVLTERGLYEDGVPERLG